MGFQRNFFAFLAAGLLFPGTALAHHDEDTLWTSRYDGGGNDFPKAMALDPQGNILVTGSSAGVGTGWDILTVKYSPQGEILWARRFNGPGNGDDFGAGLVVDSQGYIFVTGQSYTGSATGADIVLLKYSPAGGQLWQKTYGAPGTGTDDARGIVMDSSGNLYVAGTSEGDFVTLKFLPSGDTAWVRHFGGAGLDAPSGLALDGAGHLYVAGTVHAGDSTADFAVVKYSTGGDSLWSRSYNGPANLADSVTALALDRTGRAYLAGSSVGLGSGTDYAVVAYDSSGNFLWNFRYDGPASAADVPLALACDDSGYVYVTGSSVGIGSLSDYATLKLNRSGDSLWCQRFNGAANVNDVASSLVIDRAGRIYVGGWSVFDGTDYDFRVLRYRPDGRLLWTTDYLGLGGDDFLRALAPDDSGHVYGVGESFGVGPTFDYLLVKFAPCLGMQGDLNEDGDYTPMDVVLELQRVFLGTGNYTVCQCDVNCDDILSPADVVGLLGMVFEGLIKPCAE